MIDETYRERPEGPMAVAIFAVCCGVFALGIASMVNQAFNPSQWVPIPGVTSPDELQGGRKMVLMWSNFAQMTGLLFVMIIVWLVVWAILHEGLSRARRVSRRWYIASAMLLVAGLLLSFPPFYQWVFPEPVAGPLRLGRPFTYVPGPPTTEAAVRSGPAIGDPRTADRRLGDSAGRPHHRQGVIDPQRRNTS